MAVKIIAVLNQKGGCGKTTIAINLTHAFIKLGYKALLVDSDPQGSARDWNESNDGQTIPVIALDRSSLASDIKADTNGYDYIIIDGAPSLAKLSTSAVKIADFVLIPVQPSQYDIWATSDLVEIIQARRELTPNKPLAAFVISRAIKNTKLAKEVREALASYEFPVLDTHTTNLTIYPTTAGEGQSVYCVYPNSASQEIDNIRDEIIGILNGVRS